MPPPVPISNLCNTALSYRKKYKSVNALFLDKVELLKRLYHMAYIFGRDCDHYPCEPYEDYWSGESSDVIRRILRLVDYVFIAKMHGHGDGDAVSIAKLAVHCEPTKRPDEQYTTVWTHQTTFDGDPAFVQIVLSGELTRDVVKKTGFFRSVTVTEPTADANTKYAYLNLGRRTENWTQFYSSHTTGFLVRVCGCVDVDSFLYRVPVHLAPPPEHRPTVPVTISLVDDGGTGRGGYAVHPRNGAETIVVAPELFDYMKFEKAELPASMTILCPVVRDRTGRENRDSVFIPQTPADDIQYGEYDTTYPVKAVMANEGVYIPVKDVSRSLSAAPSDQKRSVFVNSLIAAAAASQQQQLSEPEGKHRSVDETSDTEFVQFLYTMAGAGLGSLSAEAIGDGGEEKYAVTYTHRGRSYRWVISGVEEEESLAPSAMGGGSQKEKTKTAGSQKDKTKTAKTKTAKTAKTTARQTRENQKKMTETRRRVAPPPSSSRRRR